MCLLGIFGGGGKKAAIVAWGRGGGFGMGSFQTGIGLSIVEFVKYIAGMNMIVWIGYSVKVKIVFQFLSLEKYVR